MPTRRRFLQQSSLLSLTPFVPTMVAHAAHRSRSDAESPVLVVVQMDGGNDGLNTVIPIADELYRNYRPTLSDSAGNAFKLNDTLALHPAMAEAKELFDDGRLSIVQSVGYPNPDRSHFRSMNIWQTARFKDADHSGYGWLGRVLDKNRTSSDCDAVYTGPDRTPVALWGRRTNTLAIRSTDDLQLHLPMAANGSLTSRRDSLTDFVSHSVLHAVDSANRLQANRKTGVAKTYPASSLGQQLRTVSQLLRSDWPARVYYAVQPGYDTHSQQANRHYGLLRDFSQALLTFLDELREAKLSEKVVVLAFSEFGRRVRENDSQGTDHGTAGPVFLAGDAVRAGIVGKAPDLSDLVDGDIRSQFDFRQIYSSLCEKWLGCTDSGVTDDHFEPLNLFKS